MIFLSSTDRVSLATLVQKRAKVIVSAIDAYNRNPHPTLEDLGHCRALIAKAAGKSKKIRALQNQQSSLSATDQKKLADALQHVDEALDAEKNLLTGLEILETNDFRVSSGLAAYRKAFGAPFAKALGQMGDRSRWLDGGAGEAKAMIEYLEGGGKGQCTAVGFEIPSTARTAVADATSEFEGRFFYASGKLFGKMDKRDLHGGEGDFDLITDLNGVLYYTESLAEDLEKYLLLLKPNGVLVFTTNYLEIEAPNAAESSNNIPSLARWAANIFGASLVRYRSANGSADFCAMKRVGDEIKVPELELADNSWKQQRPAYVYRCVHTLPNDVQTLAVKLD